MDKDKFKEIVSSIDGLCYEDTCYVLYSLLSSLDNIDGDILEIGAYKGRVSVSLALAVKEKNMQAKVFSLELNLFDTKEEFINNIKKFNLNDIIVPIFKPSSLANIGWERPLKFLFIDTDGKYFSVKCDFILWERFLLRGGIIALSCAHSLGIKRFFKKYIENSNRFNRYKMVDDIFFAYKKENTKVKVIKFVYIIIGYIIYILLKKLIYRLRRIFKFLKRTILKRR